MHFPSFCSVHVDTCGNESPFGGGGGGHLCRTHFNIPAHTYFYVQGAWYLLRFLLHVVRGLCSFDDLKTVDSEPCQQRGLLEDDRHHNEALTKAAVERSPPALRSLFAVILTVLAVRPIPTVDCSPGEPL